MNWIEFSTFIIVNCVFTLTLWIFTKSESRQDHRQLVELMISMKEDMKDFHGRLCALEERNRGK